MVRVGSLFSQLLKQIPRDTFQGLVRKFGAERYAKGFASWTHLVAMLFSQLARADSLREICNGLACCEGKLVHVGIDSAPRRSTLAYANQHRPVQDRSFGRGHRSLQRWGAGRTLPACARLQQSGLGLGSHLRCGPRNDAKAPAPTGVFVSLPSSAKHTPACRRPLPAPTHPPAALRAG